MKTNGDVYACGSNTSGQLGQGYANTRIETPVKVQGSDFDQIASGGSHNLMFKVNENYRFDEWYYRNATIYAMGDNSYNQCLAESSYNPLTSPTIVEEVENTEDTGEFLWSDNNLRPIDATYVSQNDDFLNFYNKDIRVNYTNTGAPANGYGEFAYLKFDVSNIQKEHIKSAKLNVYVKGGDTRQSTREIGVFDTYVSDWNGQTMTWNDGKPETRSLLGSFTVSANGHLIEEEDLGWHEIDVTDYLKNNCIDDKLSLALKMVSEQAHDIVIDSGVYNENFTFQDMHKNRNIPVLSIEYEAEEFYTQQRSTYSPVSDTYVSQYGSERNMNFANNEYLGVNYTSDESRTDYWGQDSYLAFNVDLTDSQREKIKSAKLWLYVDETSDTRDSTRTVSVSGNSGLNYNASGLTWSSGRPTGEYELGSFNVQGNGFELVTPGWRQIDVTEFIKTANNSELEFILKMDSNTQHPVKVRSREHLDGGTTPKLILDVYVPDSSDLPNDILQAIEISQYNPIVNQCFYGNDDKDYVYYNAPMDGIYRISIFKDNCNAKVDIFNSDNQNIYSSDTIIKNEFEVELRKGHYYICISPMQIVSYEIATYSIEILSLSLSDHMIESRFNHKCIEYDNKLYVVGGINEKGVPANTIERYNPINNLNENSDSGIWEFVSSSENYNGIGQGIVGVNENIYFCGGIVDNEYCSNIFRYNLQTNEWAVIGNINVKRIDVSVSYNSSDNSLYMAGGFNIDGYTNIIEVFDLDSKNISKTFYMPISVANPATVWYNNIYYVAAGSSSHGYENKVYAYNGDYWKRTDDIPTNYIGNVEFVSVFGTIRLNVKSNNAYELLYFPPENIVDGYSENDFSSTYIGSSAVLVGSNVYTVGGCDTSGECADGIINGYEIPW